MSTTTRRNAHDGSAIRGQVRSIRSAAMTLLNAFQTCRVIEGTSADVRAEIDKGLDELDPQHLAVLVESLREHVRRLDIYTNDILNRRG